jgi:cysteine synthase A
MAGNSSALEGEIRAPSWQSGDFLGLRAGMPFALTLTMTNTLVRQAHALHRLVGNTPLLAIGYRMGGQLRTVYAKSEQLNLTGSIKDRMALHILEQAYRDGRLLPGDTIAEATSGNTGISFAAIGRALGHPVTIFMPDWMSRERRELIASFGARIVTVGADQGGFLGCIRRAEDLAAANPRVFLPSQFSNDANPGAHEATTAPEILDQLAMIGAAPDAFVAGVGTGGTVMGVGRYLRNWNPAVRIHPLEPAESPTLSTGRKLGQHRIQGISDEFIPPVVDLGALDGIVSVHDGDAILMAQKLACELGLGVGISSGANLVGAIRLQERMGTDAVVVTVFPDSNKKYLSTDLLRAEPILDGYISPETELVGFQALPRVCSGCVDYQVPFTHSGSGLTSTNARKR